MKSLLIITGDLAAGKSCFANVLAERYDTIAFCKDTIKETLGNTIGWSNREENLKLSKAAIELMFFMFEEFSKFNKNLILESNFHTIELERLHEIAEERGYTVLTLILRGNVETLYNRFVNRINNESRHSVHLSVSLESLEEFANCIENLRKETIPGKVINIIANDFEYQTNDEILRIIDEFMQV